jgi:hypothetical protein
MLSPIGIPEARHAPASFNREFPAERGRRALENIGELLEEVPKCTRLKLQ